MTIQAGHGTEWKTPVNQAMAITATERIAPAATSRSRGPAFRIARPLGDRIRSRSITSGAPSLWRSLAPPILGQASSGSGAQAGRRFSVNARKPSWASSLVRCRAMTRAVCHLDEPWPRPRISRTIALAARVAVGPDASRSATAASTARSSASSPSTISWTSPIRAARVASNRRPPGNSARALRLADLGDDERADDRRQDPQPRLGEAEARPGLGDHHGRIPPAGPSRRPAPRRGRGRRPAPGRCRWPRTCRPSPSRPARCPRCPATSRRASSRGRRRHRTTAHRRPGPPPEAASASRGRASRMPSGDRR